MMHQTFDELKIQHFDRKYVKKVFDKSHVSFSYFLFIDEFEIHKNMYRFLKIFYLISAALFYKKRRKIVNIFTFILNSHETKIKNVVEIIRKSIQKLNACMNMNFNEFTKRICAFNMIFFENMLQQAKNVEFFSHQVIKECRTCMCSKNEKNDFEYDIVFNDKYHSITTKQRKNAANLTTKKRKIYFRNLKIKSKKSLIDRLIFVSNIILFRIYDALHFE